MHALDQLPDELFVQIIRPITFDKDSESPFNLVLTNKTLHRQATKWWKDEQDKQTIRQLLHKSYRYAASGAAAFALQNPEILGAMARDAMDPFETADASQQIISKKFPYVFRCSTVESKNPFKLSNIEILIKNNFQVTECTLLPKHQS